MADVVPITAALTPHQELQQRFCLLVLGGEVRVADRREIAQVLSGERDEHIGMYKMAAANMLMQRLLESLSISSEPKKDIAKFLVSPNTKVFDAVAFSPLPTPPNTLNYWSGSPIEPEKGCWYIIQQFLLDVICDGDIELYGYLFSFLAHMLQRPGEKPGIIIVLLGGQGTGKGTFFVLLRAIWPRTTLQVSDVDHVTGKFNAAIERSYLVCMDEALFVGDKRSADRLKSFVTEPTVTIEQKNQPRRTIESFHRFFAASNHSHFAQVDADDRRDVFLRVSDDRQGDFAYWTKVHAAIADPTVIAGMVHDLLGYDLSAFNVRERPKTREHTVQKLRSLSGFDRYWYQVLQTGVFGEGALPNPVGTWSAPCFLGTENLMTAWGQYEKGQRQYATRQESEVHEALREVRGTIERLLRTVVEVAAFVTGGSSAPVPFLLGCCTTEDKATWLKDLPGHIARELGYNLIPAIEALTVEGVPREDIDAFLATIKPRVQQLVSDCDAARTAISRSIQGEYARMKAGNSDLMRICNEALDIADLAVEFCERHRVL